MAEPCIAVSMPAWRTPARLLERAIRAVLEQTWRNLLLIVTIDGPDDETASWLYQWAKAQDDPRLFIWARPVNRGRYWSDAVAFRATESPWFAVHDADDAARPTWLEHLAHALSDGEGSPFAPVAAFGAQCVHLLSGHTRTEPVKAFDPRRGFQHLTHMAGLFSRDWLMSVGGPHPGFRVGFDTLLTALPELLDYRIARVDDVLYDRYKRRQSLTTDARTGMGSRYRERVSRELGRLWQELALDRVTHGDPRTVLASYPTRQQYDEIDEQVDGEARMLRALLAAFAPAESVTTEELSA